MPNSLTARKSSNSLAAARLRSFPKANTSAGWIPIRFFVKEYCQKIVAVKMVSKDDLLCDSSGNHVVKGAGASIVAFEPGPDFIVFSRKLKLQNWRASPWTADETGNRPGPGDGTGNGGTGPGDGTGNGPGGPA
jgi:hypothetical protein